MDQDGGGAEGAFQHILNDLFAFIATAVAGLVMVLTGFTRADAIATLIVVMLMVKAGVGLVREFAPAGLDPGRIGTLIAARPDVAEIHDLHIWEITSGEPALSAHILVEAGKDCHAVRTDLATLLATEHHIEHATLQVDHANPAVFDITDRPGPEHLEDPHA